MTDNDVPHLRQEFVARLKAHPPSTWSAELLQVVISAIDVQFGKPVAELSGPPRLTIVP
ncbi:hypothetical protein [Mycolicibacterium peregrinum]|uniref:hypothetical protein n=1 Tax=Mycolicibacterium peregrinum TaxID=43304 RepID=UPI0012FF96B1|nr:hypothetical protein [Mycolicibacterium peregrinum]